MAEPTACRRCRTQKLRCDRQLPHCSRCIRVNADCSYPPPPDRKLIAARRRAPKKIDRSPLVLTTDITAIDHQLLVDLYFKLVFKASLIYHRPSYETACQNGAMPQHSLLAVYALALNFLDPETRHNVPHRHQLQHLGDLRKLAEQYAISAGKEVLKDIDEPSLERFQTCHNLGYFWYSRGDAHRNATFSGIAYRASRSQLMIKSSKPWLEQELARRNFWCSYIQACVNPDDHIVGCASDSLALDTALPISDAAYFARIKESSVTLAEMLDANTSRKERNIWAYSLTMLALWSMIRDHIAARRKAATTQILYDTLSLLQGLDKWLLSLSPDYVYTKKNLFVSVCSGDHQLFMTMHGMHHYCRLALHSSLVPKFSETAPKDLTQEAVRMNTEASIRSAQNLTELANDVMTFEGDFTQLPPYIGYCMYVAGSIHLTMINSQALGENAKKQLSLALAVLQHMRPFWAIVQHLWTRLLEKCEDQVAKGALTSDIFPDEMPKPITSYSLTKLKAEETAVDADTVLSKISPVETQELPQINDMLQDEPLDFDELAQTYGDDWWQFDVTSLGPITDLMDFV